ncbi:MAG: hypothetical protein LBS97_02840 [Treponema sp.]|nr:hypothetical protein [Treponema sp.]
MKIYGIIALGIAYYTGIWLLVPGFSITAFFFFSLGAYFSIHGKNMVLELRKGKIMWGILACITMILCVYYDGTKTRSYFSPVYVLSGVISAVNIASYLLERGKITVRPLLSESTFFIYAMHMVLVLSITGMIFDFIFRPEQWYLLIVRYVTVPLAAAGICVFIYWAMKRVTPKILGILTGGRV